MKNIADHLFDILENSVKAKATEIKILIKFKQGKFHCRITDNGTGIKIVDKEVEATDPFVTSRKERRVGLGLPLLKSSAESTKGFFKIYNLKKGGCYLEFTIDLLHIDAKPFGDLAQAILDALVCWPEIDLSLWIEKSNQQKEEIFNSKKLKKVLEIEDLKEKKIRDFLYQLFWENFNQIGINKQFGYFQKI